MPVHKFHTENIFTNTKFNFSQRQIVFSDPLHVGTTFDKLMIQQQCLTKGNTIADSILSINTTIYVLEHNKSDVL